MISDLIVALRMNPDLLMILIVVLQFGFIGTVLAAYIHFGDRSGH